MRKTWIVVGNSTYCKVYQAENVHKLTEIKNFEHLESHMKADQLVSDSQGRNSNPGLYGSDTMELKTSLKTKESVIFARQIIDYLEEGLKDGKFERLYIIAKPPFLGYIRELMTAKLTHFIQGEINKDLTQLTGDQIREYLPQVL